MQKQASKRLFQQNLLRSCFMFFIANLFELPAFAQRHILTTKSEPEALKWFLVLKIWERFPLKWIWMRESHERTIRSGNCKIFVRFAAILNMRSKTLEETKRIWESTQITIVVKCHAGTKILSMMKRSCARIYHDSVSLKISVLFRKTREW